MIRTTQHRKGLSPNRPPTSATNPLFSASAPPCTQVAKFETTNATKNEIADRPKASSHGTERAGTPSVNARRSWKGRVHYQSSD